MSWIGTTDVGAEKFEPCPNCGADAVYGESNGFLRGTEYTCDECEYHPAPVVIRSDRPEGVPVTREHDAAVGITADECFFAVVDDAVVLGSESIDGEESTHVPAESIQFDEIVVEEPAGAENHSEEVVRVPRDGDDDLAVSSRGQADVADVLLLLATVDPTTDDSLDSAGE